MAAKQKQKQENERVWKLNGKVVKPCLYNGSAIGHGKYYAAEVDGQLIYDDAGRPAHFRSVGRLELVGGDKK